LRLGYLGNTYGGKKMESLGDQDLMIEGAFDLLINKRLDKTTVIATG
jgi:hypothetical protein